MRDGNSRGGVGGEQAVGDRGRAGGAASGGRGPDQDTLHRSLPHRRIYLERQGNDPLDRFAESDW